jgi:carbonic anhydrase
MNRFKQLLLANRAWSVEKADDDPNYFTRTLTPHNPVFMWIGSSDSRVVPERITRSPPGSLYIHRNLGNLVDENDLNLMADVEHALEDMNVRHIILCGHFGCTSLEAVLRGGASNAIERWLEPARAVLSAHRAEIDEISGHEAKLSRFIELNVQAQLLRLARTDSVRAAFRRGSELKLHGWVYDLRDGLIKRLLEINRETDLDALPLPPKVLV